MSLEDPMSVKVSQAMLKGHVTFWWKEVQSESRRDDREIITRWNRMVSKMKTKVLLSDYQLELLKDLQNL